MMFLFRVAIVLAKYKEPDCFFFVSLIQSPIPPSCLFESTIPRDFLPPTYEKSINGGFQGGFAVENGSAIGGVN